jgi:hypothetical protein
MRVVAIVLLSIASTPMTSEAQVTRLADQGGLADTSIVVGADGLGFIAYYDRNTSQLRAAHCSDARCLQATFVTVDTGTITGSSNATALGVDGLPLIAYYDGFNQRLKVAHCEDVQCAVATVTVLDDSGATGSAPSIAIGADGLGLIAYYDGGDAVPRVAHCSNVACTSASIAALDTPGLTKVSTAVARGADGLGVIAFSSYREGDASNTLTLGRCLDVACTAFQKTVLDAGRDLAAWSVAVGSDQRPLVAFSKGAGPRGLYTAHCNDAACSAATVVALDGNGINTGASLAIGSDGLPLIAYSDFQFADLQIAHCLDAACATSVVGVLHRRGYSGTGASLTIGADGRGLISHTSNASLMSAHCWDVACGFVAPPRSDFDGDGEANVLLRTPSGTLRVLRTQFTTYVQGWFLNPQTWADGFVPWRYDIDTGDFNGDGRTDLVSRNRDDGAVEVFLSDGTRFRYGGLWSWGWLPSAYDLFFGDVTGDGRTDLVARVTTSPNAGGWQVGDIYVFPSDGAGFSSSQSALWSYGWTNGYELALGDTDGDGDDDLMGRYTGGPEAPTGDVYVARSTGGQFVFVGLWTYGFDPGYRLELADVDGDGRADLVARYLGTDTSMVGLVYVMRSTGDAFSWLGNTSPWADEMFPDVDMVLRDFDSDGRADIGLRLATGQVYVRFATNGSFEPYVGPEWIRDIFKTTYPDFR